MISLQRSLTHMTCTRPTFDMNLQSCHSNAGIGGGPRRRKRLHIPQLFAVLVALASGAAVGGMPDAINRARAQGCGVAAGPLRENTRLIELARLLSLGTPLATAVRQAGYPAVRIVSLQVPGAADDQSLEQSLTQHLCPRLSLPDLRDLGAYRQGGDVWIALAAPFQPPDPRDAAVISSRVLALTNAARAEARRCGSSNFPAAAPVSLDPRLTAAADEHSRDMALHGFLDHRGTDGTHPDERMARAGYDGRLFGENVASGDATAESVVSGWLASPEHCRTLMAAGFQQMGVAFGVNLDSEGRVYWTQVFGEPRSRSLSR
jgi:uncharacterized protein YkwD